jgi:hypothetical protein
VNVHCRSCEHYASSVLKFTLDGKLVGDVAEVIAAKSVLTRAATGGGF